MSGTNKTDLTRKSVQDDDEEEEGEEEKEGDLPTVEGEIEEPLEVIEKHVRMNVELSEETLPAKANRRAIIKHCVIVSILFLIWCTYTISIIKRKETIHNPLLMVIKSKMEKLLPLQVETTTKTAIKIYLTGPFEIEQDFKEKRDEGKPQLMLQVVKQLENDKMEIISNMEHLIISRPHELEYVLSADKELNIDLTEDIRKYKGKVKIFLKMKTNIDKDLTVKMSYIMTPVDQNLGIIYGAFVLLFLYVLIIWDIINRTLASMIASMLAIGIMAALNDRPSAAKVLSWLDVETLMLLFGMMVLISILSESGIFDYLAVLAYEIAQGDLFKLIYILCYFPAFLSAFLDNVTMMLLMTPVTIRLCEVTNLNPVPVLMSMVIYSNVGAAFTPVGDPPNLIIMNNPSVRASGIGFATFIVHMLPGVLLGMLTIFIFLYLKYPTITHYMNKQSLEVEALKHEIQVWEKAANVIQPTTTDEEIVQNTLHKKALVLKQKLIELEEKSLNVVMDYQTALDHMKAAYPIRNKALLIKSSFAFIFVLMLFISKSVPDLQYLSLGWSALVGALLLIILSNADIEAVLSRLEWSTLIFFACLFIIMEALTELGLIGALGKLCVKIILKAGPENRLLVAILIILWGTGIASAFLNNIPVTTMMIKIVENLSQNKELDIPLSPLVWALTFGACFGGNGTLIGASANVVSSGVSEQHGYRMSFMNFFLFGFPLTICTLITITFYLYFAHCFWTWH